MIFPRFFNPLARGDRQQLRVLINRMRQSLHGVLMIMLLACVVTRDALAHHEAGRQPPPQTQAATAGTKSGKGAGLIQQIDRDKGMVTIKHGPLQGINMPAMTASYRVKDKAMLSDLWSPQTVVFELTYDGKQYLITHIK